jgi:hypothetical protein
MSESVEVPQESKDLVEATPIQFPEVTTLRPCSILTCTNGHEWAPTLALAKCGYGTPQGWNGCGTPLLALRMTTCPTCQEPIAEFRLRIDITPPCPFPMPLCIPGTAEGTAEHLMVVIKPDYWKSTEAVETAKLQQQKEPING